MLMNLKSKLQKPLVWCLVLLAIFLTGASFDNRHFGPRYPVARLEFTQQSWADGESTAATVTLANVNGLCEQIEVIINNNTNDVTGTVTITDADSGQLFTKSGISENASTILKATSDATDFDAFLACGTLTATITPSGDPGTSGVTIDVYMYLR